MTGEPVGSENKGRGYEIGKDQFLMVEDEELESIQVESTHTIDIDLFVPRDQIDERYLDSPYYIAPTDKIGQEAFAVIREAMRDKKMVGVGRVVIARRERPIMLEPFGKGILGTTLRYPYEVREAEGYFEDVPDIELSDEMRELAAHILETKRVEFDPAKFEDRYETALVTMLKFKQAGMPMKPKLWRRGRRMSSIFSTRSEEELMDTTMECLDRLTHSAGRSCGVSIIALIAGSLYRHWKR